MLKKNHQSLVIVATLSAVLMSPLSFAQSKSAVELLSGEWKGEVTVNKIPKALQQQNVTKDDAKTEVAIKLSGTTSLSGTSLVGKNLEEWTIDAETYVWKDNTPLKVTAKAQSIDTLPEWIKADLKAYGEKAATFAYKYASCDPAADCGANLARAYWTFTVTEVSGKKVLYTGVYYATTDAAAPAADEQRILTEKLSQ